MAPAPMLYSLGVEMRRLWGAIAQLGERYNGIVEVSGSIPLSSTNLIHIGQTRGQKQKRRRKAPFVFLFVFLPVFLAPAAGILPATCRLWPLHFTAASGGDRQPAVEQQADGGFITCVTKCAAVILQKL